MRESSVFRRFLRRIPYGFGLAVRPGSNHANEFSSVPHHGDSSSNRPRPGKPDRNLANAATGHPHGDPGIHRGRSGAVTARSEPRPPASDGGPSALSCVRGNAADRHCVCSPRVRTRKDSNNPRIPRSSPMVFTSGGYSDGQLFVPTPRPISTHISPRSVLNDTTRTMKPGPWHQSGYSILTVSNMTRPFGRYCWSTG